MKTLVITSELVRAFSAERETHTFVFELSELQAWARMHSLDFSGKRISTNLGNGLDFFPLRIERDLEGDWTEVVYRQDLGCLELVVLND